MRSLSIIFMPRQRKLPEFREIERDAPRRTLEKGPRACLDRDYFRVLMTSDEIREALSFELAGLLLKKRRDRSEISALRLQARIELIEKVLKLL